MKLIHLVRRLALTAGALAVLTTSGVVLAQTYPHKPIRMVVPWPAGGPSDLVGRELAQRMSAVLGQTIVVENRGGANGVPGADAVAKAAPDGYTLMFHNLTSHVTNPAIYKTLPYDTVKDFAPITQVTASSLLIVANPSFAPRTLGELIADAKARPGQINFASFGLGSLGHLGIGKLQVMTGVSLNHIPYKGSAPAVIDTLAGHTPVCIVGFANALPYLKTNRLRAIAITGASRSPQLPNVPTVAETEGLAGYDMSFKQALWAPARTPPAIIARLNEVATAIIRSPEFKARSLVYGMDEVTPSTPEQMAATVQADMETIGKLVKTLNLTPE
jgi:tripartite-type tricarboxylate transporter receptor subunit TctC